MIIERARQDASRIIALALDEARSTVEEIHETARQEGFKTGHDEGLVQGRNEGHVEARDAMRQQLETLHASWSTLLDSWEQTESTRRGQATKHALEMALALSERITHRQVKHDPEIVIEQLRQALELAQSPADLEILVAESDRHRVHKALPGLLERFENTGYVSIRTCEDMAPGGCCLRMRGGEVDASLEVQLQRLAEAILPRAYEPATPEVEPESEAA